MKGAATLFLEAVPTFGSYELMTYEKLVFYTVVVTVLGKWISLRYSKRKSFLQLSNARLYSTRWCAVTRSTNRYNFGGFFTSTHDFPAIRRRRERQSRADSRVPQRVLRVQLRSLLRHAGEAGGVPSEDRPLSGAALQVLLAGHAPQGLPPVPDSLQDGAFSFRSISNTRVFRSAWI